MFVVTLRGGLGNQMFQYALARKLETLRRQPVFLDTSALTGIAAYPRDRSRSRPSETSTLSDCDIRHFGLPLFNIGISSLPAGELPRIAANSSIMCSVTELQPAYESAVFGVADFPLVVFNGFWQSERYFVDIAQLLRADFTLHNPLPADTPFLEQLRRPDSVCLHVRRQDYVRGGGEHLGFIGTEYYRSASAALIERVPEAHFFVFSDDIGWCIERLPIDHAHTFVHYDPGPAAAALTLTMMSYCAHFIIGNSTFAWWAAWLGRESGKLVVAPRGWFAAERDASAILRPGTLASKDLIPSAWIRV